MIIGNGLLAKAYMPFYQDDPLVTIFASGVSNSRETEAEPYARERAMLEQALEQSRHLVYFSSCSIQDPKLAASPYVQHKVAMEQLVAERAAKWTILRLPQVVGRVDNPYTLTNFMHHQIDTGARFQVWSQARRNLIDVDDVATIGRELLSSGSADHRMLNVACPFSIPVIELVRMFETLLGREANYELVDAGASYTIEVSDTLAAAARIGIEFGPHYIDRLIRKYYDHAQ